MCRNQLLFSLLILWHPGLSMLVDILASKNCKTCLCCWDSTGSSTDRSGGKLICKDPGLCTCIWCNVYSKLIWTLRDIKTLVNSPPNKSLIGLCFRVEKVLVCPLLLLHPPPLTPDSPPSFIISSTCFCIITYVIQEDKNMCFRAWGYSVLQIHHR